MTNDSTPNSFFSMVTGKSDEDMSMDDSASIVKSEDENQKVCPNSSSTVVSTPESVSSGDSEMPHDARRALVHLMRQGTVMASQKPKLFDLVCRHEPAIRKHLSEVYLQLVLDQKSGVVFVAASTSEHADGLDNDESASEESTTLVSKRTLSLYDTLILLVLRKHYQDRESAGEQKITIDIERLESYLTPFLPITDHASKDRKKLLARVKEMIKRKLLSTIRGAEDRYEITPIIRYVVSASFLESMLEEYTALALQQSSEQAGESTGIDNSLQGMTEELMQDDAVWEKAEKGECK